MGWYSEVSRDVGKIPNAIAFFEAELQEARVECKLSGNLERASASMPGVVEHRFNQLQEIEAILNYLNIELRRLRIISKRSSYGINACPFLRISHSSEFSPTQS